MKGDMYLAWSKKQDLREKAGSGGAVTEILRYLLESKKVDAVVTVRPITVYHGVPAVITDPKDLIDSAGVFYCVSENLPRLVKEYLNGAFDTKIAFVGRSCDIRAVIEIAKRNKINLENVILLGLSCTGTISPVVAREMAEKEFGVNPEEVLGHHIDEGKLTLILKDGKEITKDLKELEEKGLGRRNNCRRCEVPIPRMADLAFGRWGGEKKKATFIEVCSERGDEILNLVIQAGYLEVEKPTSEEIEERAQKERSAIELAHYWQERDFGEYKKMSIEERFEFWKSQFNQCIKCCGCRDACPICYCDECVLEPGRGVIKPGAVPPGWTFSIIRAFHVSDSCLNCGQCQDVCPSLIPLSQLIFLVNREIKEVFGYEPGVEIEQKPPLAWFDEKEKSIEKIELTASDLK